MPILALPVIVLLALWLTWGISWRVVARWSSSVASVAPKDDENRFRGFTIAGVALIFLPLFVNFRLLSLYDPSVSLGWFSVALATAGFAVCWWARLHLGTLWSAAVARKQNHKIIDSGPYAFVRHPIYTGVIVAALATGLAQGTAIAFAGVALVALSFYIKARQEEAFLRQELGADYDAYSARTPMLVPFWPFH